MKPSRKSLSWLALLGLALAIPSLAQENPEAEKFPPEALEFFEKSVRPLLIAKCQECHGPSKQEANLRLDSRASILAGGDNGPAIVPGDPEHSLLITALHYRDDGPQMPPKGKLEPEKIEIFARWVKLNAPWSSGVPSLPAENGEGPGYQIRPEDREFWSFRPVREPPLPLVRDAGWLETGVDAFILSRLEASGYSHAARADKRVLLRRVTFDLTGLPPTPEEMTAFLADDSPSAFERVVDRLLASPAYGERMTRLWLDVARYGEDQAHTFEARKYPQGFRYRDWLIDAFNRDLPYDEFVRQQIAADLYEGPDKIERLPALGYFACGPVYYGDKNQMDQIADRIDALTRGFLGLTVACARCHDHKFDPIPAMDYYSLAGVFASTEYAEVPLVSPEEVAEIEKTVKDAEKKKKNRAKKYPLIHALQESAQPRNLQVHVRGSGDTLGPEAPRRFLQVLSSQEKPLTTGSGRRELAEAIASAENPLTARVLVNRLWQMHFGQGLVRTASNFGALGERPTHPELLDYLAAKLMREGWSIKSVHREIVLSATYQQSAAVDDAMLAADPENRLWGRANRRRLDAEPWRDAMLAVSGELDGTLGGPSADLAGAENRRRTLYGFVSRHELDPFLRLFDFPDPNITADRRAVTTVPLQQLFVLNSEFMIARAKALAARVHREHASDDRARVEAAYALVYVRPPSPSELELALGYLSKPEASTEPPPLSRWERYAQILLGANEFLHVD